MRRVEIEVSGERRAKREAIASEREVGGVGEER